MSDESDIDVMNFVSRKGKRSSRIEDSGSSSDSPVEQRKKHKGVLRVASDPENGSSDSDSPLEKCAARARVPRVMSDIDESSDESEESHWDEDDDDDDDDDYDCDTSEEEGEDENASEAYSSAGSEESENSIYSDWESLDETEDPGVLQSVAAAAFHSNENKVCVNGPSSSSSKAAPPANYMSDSSDGQSEKCPICLRNFTTQEIGTPEACDHSFCVECLQEWSRNVNTCPVDRRMFTVILVRRCLEGRVIRRIPVEPPRQQVEDEVQEDPTYCEVCGECDREDRMLLCDGCDLGYHLECLDPPMDTVPLEEWFCPECTLSNSGHLAEEVDIQDGELMALLEDAPIWGLSPLRPRLSRLLPRTRQSERVRATMMTRQREGHQQRYQAQPSTSSGIDSLEADSNTSAGSIRRKLMTNTTRTAQKRRKTTRRKATRKRTKKRKTTAARKPKVTTSSAKNSLNEVSKRRHKKRRKIKRKKRKVSN
jgi:PHD and RING finger domain-containing protein 1